MSRRLLVCTITRGSTVRLDGILDGTRDGLLCRQIVLYERTMIAFLLHSKAVTV